MIASLEEFTKDASKASLGTLLGSGGFRPDIQQGNSRVVRRLIRSPV